MNFILASTSPRRKELLGLIVPQFSCQAPQFDESLIDITDAKQKALTLSREKCKDVASKCNDKNVTMIENTTLEIEPKYEKTVVNLFFKSKLEKFNSNGK